MEMKTVFEVCARILEVPEESLANMHAPQIANELMRVIFLKNLRASDNEWFFRLYVMLNEYYAGRNLNSVIDTLHFEKEDYINEVAKHGFDNELFPNTYHYNYIREFAAGFSRCSETELAARHHSGVLLYGTAYLYLASRGLIPKNNVMYDYALQVYKKFEVAFIDHGDRREFQEEYERICEAGFEGTYDEFLVYRATYGKNSEHKEKPPF